MDDALTVDGLSDGIDHTSHQTFAYLDRGNAFGTFDSIAFIDGGSLSQHHNADIVLLKVLDDALLASGKLHQLAGLGVVQTVDTSNAVTNGQHGAYLFQCHIDVGIGQLFFQNCRYFGRFNF